ncbi:hypothetical protein BS78_02G281100 [Paspalum vaginatum]|uniref:Uncharacterized protein n=1 Tax=Paspalum vaginatum TaxID=158149 RepID=A0A9W8CCT7_9POAL|nr:hypothetical protein BS78_K050500 [Paspalum vaginatum]KAJ1290945.1 hypothetical protein BS78_02G281100 [Paspalum vaginatum]
MVIPPPSSRSAGMRSIRRELQRRRSKLAPTKSAIKKVISAQPPREAGERRPHLPRREAPSCAIPSHSLDAAAAAAPQPVPVSPPVTSRSTASVIGSACRSTPAAAAPAVPVTVRPGTLVGVRTKTTKLKTGQVLVLWLRAMVVSRTDAGYEVVYEGNWPPADPYGTVHVARDHVRLIKASPSLTTPPPPSSLPPSTTNSSCASATTATVAATRKKEVLPEPRPTTAGKKLRLIRNPAREMEG